MNFRLATVEDLDWIAENSINQKVDRKMEACVDYTYTLEHNGVILGCGGFRMITKATAWCWVDLSHEAGKHTLTLFRTIKEWMDTFVKDKELRRLQAFVRTDSDEALRLVQHLGFYPESLMKNFYGDDDALLYVRLI